MGRTSRRAQPRTPSVPDRAHHRSKPVPSPAQLRKEHSTSAVNWQPRNIAKRPGEMMRNSLQHVARGADSVMFFQWRASRFGAEKFHSAMLPHAGTDSKVWRDVVELGGVLDSLSSQRIDQFRGYSQLIEGFHVPPVP